MKFGKLFSRKKTEPEKAKPEETMACPYCGFKNPKYLIENRVLGKHDNISNWMSRYNCPRCRKDFWVVGQYGKVKYAKPFSDIRFA